MKPTIRTTATICLAAFMLLAACGHMSSIEVSYQAPAPANVLSGRVFNLIVEQDLKGQPLLGKGASKMLPHFNNTFVLTVNRHGNRFYTEGGLDLSQLYSKAVRERLEALGATVVNGIAPGEDTIKIVIDSFTIDKTGRKWTGATSYEATYVRDGKAVRQEAVKAEVERVTLLGPKSVNIVASDLVETAVNRLNIERLLSGI